MDKMISVTTRKGQSLEFLLLALTSADRGTHLSEIEKRVDVIPSEEIARMSYLELLALVRTSEQGMPAEQPRVSFVGNAAAWKMTWTCSDGTYLCLSGGDCQGYRQLSITGRLKNVIDHGKRAEVYIKQWKGVLILAGVSHTPPLEGYDVCSAAIAAADLLFND